MPASTPTHGSRWTSQRGEIDSIVGAVFWALASCRAATSPSARWGSAVVDMTYSFRLCRDQLNGCRCGPMAVAGGSAHGLAVGVEEPLHREVPFARVVGEGEHDAAVGDLGQLCGDRRQRGPGGRTDEDSLFAGDADGVGERVLLADPDDAVDGAEVEVARHEARPDPL